MTRNKQLFVLFTVGVVLGVSLMFAVISAYNYTSSDEYCQSCHIHPEADQAWEMSVHVNSKSGVKVHCVDCHLPRKKGPKQWVTKAQMGVRDLWSYMTKDSASFDWESRRQLEHAVKYIPNESCKDCHVNLFPAGITDNGVTSHLYYTDNEEKLDLQCISCHLDAGHAHPSLVHQKMSGVPTSSAKGDIFNESTAVTNFESYTEKIPGTSVTIDMKAIPGGAFKMGSPDGEPYRNVNEGPVRNVTVSPFYMSELEVTWEQYWAFYGETFSEGRITPETIYANNSRPDVDAVSGPTPPFGFPDQGWGGVNRPAITMTHYAAETFCQWLSIKTGKKYRLPTEAEWEFAARGGTETPYFFPGNPKKFTSNGFWRRFFDADTIGINSYVVYELNSQNKTKEPAKMMANPYGLKNMLGNVLEYCSDYYEEDAYSKTQIDVTDPKGPESGTERVVRGGAYFSDAIDVRCASRASTKHDDWLKTDPQQPKSIWWYSDIKGIGFRVVVDAESAKAPAKAYVPKVEAVAKPATK